MSASDPNKIVNAEGIVKWFDPKKGFGFIIGPDGQDIFAHFTKIEGDGFRVLRDASRVMYDAERGDKGWNASRIARIDDPIEDAAAVKKQYSRSPRR
ncbi:MAG: cold shock domain-containing protein [Phycisphaerales bacterium]|jgi:CspA family cold shock protein|nr:cold shock domain-containing protein [Phycisphaerales bacterium]